jgi:hypothetical protein
VLSGLPHQDPEHKKEPFRVSVSQIKEVVPGAYTPALQRKMFGHKQALPECSFAIFFRRADETELSLEAKSSEEASRWLTALDELIRLSSAASGF